MENIPKGEIEMKKTNGIYADIINEKIYVTKVFAKRASVIGSDEHKSFMHHKKAYHGFEVEQKITNIRRDKVKHTGMTVEWMERYVTQHPLDDSTLTDFHAIVYDYTGHPAFYSKVKSWFLKQYPDFTAKVVNAERAREKKENEEFKAKIEAEIKARIEAEYLAKLIADNKVTVFTQTSTQKDEDVA